MANESRQPIEADKLVSPELAMEQSGRALTAREQVESYLRRKTAVTEADHRAFQDYVNRKAETPPVAVTEPAPPPHEPPSPSRFNRRNLLKVVAGTAVAGEAAAVAYPLVTGGSVSDQGAKHAGDRYTEAQRHNIERTLIASRSDVGGRGLGKWIALLPTKLDGGTYALDLNTNRVLSSIWYWTYGDFNPISHHLCAFPSADPLPFVRVR
jgi:thiocyanate desulfurase